EMQELLDRTIQVVRDVATSLRPAVVDLGVIPAIEWLATDFSRRYGITCHLEVAEPAQALTGRQTEVIFRIAQETLTNVARHANAKQVWMALGHEGGVFFMEIQDDGRGLPEGFQAGERTFGMLGMGERARSVGGEILIAGRPGQGVRVYLELPLVEGGPS
ncbi:MAG: sensory protein, two-component system, partial [Rhodocyclaceae bacterium]|nr:sensory protein, two-component system [Rhodocyclaceae bacterium]